LILADNNQASTVQREALKIDLTRAQDLLAVKQSQVHELESHEMAVRDQLAFSQKFVTEIQSELAEAKVELQETTKKVSERERQISEASARQQEIEAILSRRAHDDVDFEELRNALTANTETVEILESRVAEAEAARSTMEVLELGARQELDITREQVERLKTDVTLLEEQNAEGRDRLQSLTIQKEGAIQ